MITPVRMHQSLLDDISSTKTQTDGFRLWWLGQSGFLLQWNGKHLLMDPYLSDSLTHKYARTDKPHVRMTELVIDPGRLDFIDVVTSSHNHTDHLDGDTLIPLMKVNQDIVVLVPTANVGFAAQRLGCSPDRLTPVDDGGSVHRLGFTIHALPAAHEAVQRDDHGHCRFLGYVFQFGQWIVYHSGDTVMYEGMMERLSKWSIDVAILPINGRAAERRVAGNLWGEEAARLAQVIGARCVIPCHYDMFTFNTASPDEFTSTARAIGQRHQVLACGERWSSEMLEVSQR